MKIWKNKFLKRMIILITVVYLIVNCIVPNQVYANKATPDLIVNFADIAIAAVGAIVTGFAVVGAVPSGGLTLAAIPAVAGTIAKGAVVTYGVMKAKDVAEHGVENIPGNILKEFLTFTVAISDVIMGVLQGMMLEDIGLWSDTMISNQNDNLGSGILGDEDSGSWLYAGQEDVDSLLEGKPTDRGSALMSVERAAIEDGIIIESYEVPNILYSPENIFANKIAALDANYINPHEYTGVNEEVQPQSLAENIGPTIATWYRAFRNIAIVGLLSVLVYIGIRIVMGTVVEKAKYKERLQDWFIALCMIFFMHFIMAGIMMLSEKIIDLIDATGNTGIIIAVDDGCIFRTTFTGYIRFFAQSNNWKVGTGYSLMYLILVGITLRYTFIYLKRALYLAFFTVIAPMVALTYPIDKIKDSQAQAFDMWIKEYFFNAIIQPVHLLLFTVLVGSTMSLAIKNPIYGIVILLFMPTAENWIKRMFKMDKAPLSATSLGDVAVLGSIFGTAKNMTTGIIKGVGNTVEAISTGGPGAVGTGVKDSVLAAPFRFVGNAISSVQNRLGDASGSDVEDSVNQNTEETNNNTTTNNIYEQSRRMDDFRDRVSDENLRNYQNQGEEEERNRQRAAEEARRNFSVVADDVNWSEVSNDNVNGIPIVNLDDIDQTSNSNTDANQQQSNIPRDGNTTEAKPIESENDRAEMKEKNIKSITSGGEAKDIKDMVNRGLAGAAGAMVGAGFGALGAGLTEDNKMIIAGTLGGASLASSLTDELIKAGDSTFNNNVKILVKADGITDKNIIKNTAEVAKKEGWSEDKMKLVAQMAEKYPNLAKNSEQQRALQEELKAAGIKSEKLIQRAIKDITKVQVDVEKIKNKEDEKSNKNVEKWK